MTTVGDCSVLANGGDQVVRLAMGCPPRYRRCPRLGARAFAVIVALSGCTPVAETTVTESLNPISLDSERPTPASSAAPVPTASTTAPVAVPDPKPTPTALAVPTVRPIETHTMFFSGDVLSHTPVMAKAASYGEASGWAYDYRPMYDHLRDRISGADLALCVLETPVSADNERLTGYPMFNAPTELPAALYDAGYDGCSTASNHSLDRGPSGIVTTLDLMDEAGLGHAGMARTEAESMAPTVYALGEMGELNVAHLSWTYGLNGLALPEDRPWMANVTDLDAIASEAERARHAGADIVVLSIQWGNEYQRSPSEGQLYIAERLSGFGTIDLIVGNHVHVVQPITTINGVPVVYGLGNSLSNQYDRNGRSGTQDGLAVEVQVTGNVDVGWTVDPVIDTVPTWVDRNSYRIIDVSAALADPQTEAGTRAELEASLARTIEAVQLLGYQSEPSLSAG